MPNPTTEQVAGPFTLASGSAAVDVRGAGPDGVDKVLFSNVAAGAQASADVAVGDYTNVRALEAGSSTVVTTMGTVPVLANAVYYEYR